MNSFEGVQSDPTEQKDKIENGPSPEQEFTQQRYNKTRIEKFFSNPNWMYGEQDGISRMAQLAKDMHDNLSKLYVAWDINSREFDSLEKLKSWSNDAFNKLDAAERK